MNGRDLQEFREDFSADGMLDRFSEFCADKLFEQFKEKLPPIFHSEDVEVLGEMLMSDFYALFDMHFKDRFMGLSWNTDCYPADAEPSYHGSKITGSAKYGNESELPTFEWDDDGDTAIIDGNDEE